MYTEEFEGTKGVIRIHQAKDGQIAYKLLKKKKNVFQCKKKSDKILVILDVYLIKYFFIILN